MNQGETLSIQSAPSCFLDSVLETWPRGISVQWPPAIVRNFSTAWTLVDSLPKSRQSDVLKREPFLDMFLSY
jgi:hypothetical protein